MIVPPSKSHVNTEAGVERLVYVINAGVFTQASTTVNVAGAHGKTSICCVILVEQPLGSVEVSVTVYKPLVV